jgi:hypothetical protein
LNDPLFPNLHHPLSRRARCSLCRGPSEASRNICCVQTGPAEPAAAAGGTSTCGTRLARSRLETPSRAMPTAAARQSPPRRAVIPSCLSGSARYSFWRHSGERCEIMRWLLPLLLVAWSRAQRTPHRLHPTQDQRARQGARRRAHQVGAHQRLDQARDPYAHIPGPHRRDASGVPRRRGHVDAPQELQRGLVDTLEKVRTTGWPVSPTEMARPSSSSCSSNVWATGRFWTDSESFSRAWRSARKTPWRSRHI